MERSTTRTYASTFLSYSAFCQHHGFPIRPTADTLSFFMVYMCHFIRPSSVKSYLSGICAELEAHWPDVREIRKSHLVTRTLAGCMKLHGTSARRKRALTQDDLIKVISSIPTNPNHDDLLFAAIIFTGWHCLMRLGELVDPDATDIRDYRKTITCHSISFNTSPRPHVSFTLPMHKANHFFEGSTIVLEQHAGLLDPLPVFQNYLTSRD